MKKYRLKDGKIMIVREGNGKDADRVLQYIKRVACESDNLTFGEGEFNTTLEEEVRFIEECRKSKNSLFLIAEYRGEIISCLTFSGGNRSRIKHYGEFGITVLKKYWGLGVGKTLINCLIKWAKDSGIIRKINLKVKADNTKAIALYTKLGFVKEGAISRFFYHKGEFHDVYVMGLEID
ncbi:GNAT family N-acetyltransferase [Paramaledivibacter caminithermalis]|uniref:Protein N-acetyltransferase, RimJ/RimL family n=1 Tax=Paramaledivibacter caminithermalis (strain DSM 15212 / CIP 107654 / DViRD3) TaxID=1121301 RepID=A0A1M6NZT1_PARC5|nr:GNAT family N-acetyltransferase [Paramaledivibacter caminithermalis]SHK01153.1 Protein N-acetyltransferase, RimJ/RimL family [Paramaledivibacter caminithermalis DSM 15212]